MPRLPRLAHKAPVMQAIITLQWHIWVQETFDINIKVAQTKQNIWNFICRKVKPTEEMAKFGDYLGDFILWSNSEDREIQSKNWSLPD